LDYILKRDIKPEHRAWLAARHLDNFYANSATGLSSVKSFSQEETESMIENLCAFTVDVSMGQIAEDCEIRGVKAGLKKEKARLSEKEFHDL
jgi:hypothetical protein